MDTKKKEHQGNFYRDGQVYSQQALQTYDHDFASFAEGMVIPHALDDLGQNTGYISLMEPTRTSQGLSVTVQIIDKVYETGRKVAKSFKQNLPILFDDLLPQWNYRALPNQTVI